MTPLEPVEDCTLLLPGHSVQMPVPDADRKMMESEGCILTSDLTPWVGQWGISYTANLTPDETGIGNRAEEQFIYSPRNDVMKGLPGSWPTLPPIPWVAFRHMSDEEIKAMFIFLKSLKPVKNPVPPPSAPAMAAK